VNALANNIVPLAIKRIIENNKKFNFTLRKEKQVSI
jgi:hypothetical protein